MRLLIVLSALFLAAPIVTSRLTKEEVYGDFYPDGSTKTVRTMRRTLDGELENHGRCQSFYESGKLESTGQYFEGMREGEWLWYYEDGALMARCDYHADEGQFSSYYPDGKILRSGRMLGLEREGMWTEWYENGDKRMEGLFLRGQQHGLWTYWSEGDPTRTRKVLWDRGKPMQ
jgi:antitoxin component YwqK of YwqJK toxin-antitoxin module